MSITKSILGMNARNFLYIRRYNTATAKRRADDKLATKKLLIKHTIQTPELLASFYHVDDIKHFDWKLPKRGFVIKPARGYGGGGIVVVKSWDGQIATTHSGETYTKQQIQSHIYDIFDGAYSLQFLPDKAYIEGLVTPASFFKKFNMAGVPDLRIIVFHNIPVMAMLRLPTRQSHSKANLHLGAIGVGIDMRTGITTHGLYKGDIITYIPDTKVKIAGIKIPNWHEILLLASKTAQASKLGYAGVDMVLDEQDGPLILEINARPGLAIQNANLASLRTRLERVEDMKIETSERAVEVAQSLFAENFSDRVHMTPKILKVIQPVMLHGNRKQTAFDGVIKKEVLAKLDTGAFRTALDKKIVQELQLPLTDKKIFVQSASGKAYRPTVMVTFDLAGKTIKTVASVVERSHLKFPVIIGRRDLKGFLIEPDYGSYPEEKE